MLNYRINCIIIIITFRVRRSQVEMYIGNRRRCVCLCVCLSVPRRIPTLLHGSGCKLGNGMGCPLVVHHWADLQCVSRFRWYDNMAPNAKCQQVLVLALCLVFYQRSWPILYTGALEILYCTHMYLCALDMLHGRN